VDPKLPPALLRDDGSTREHDKDNTHIFYKEKYHWSWFIPLDEEVVSVGVVCPAAYFLEKKESRRDFLIRELHELHPELSRYTADMTDLFAGRIYERQPSPALDAFRSLLGRQGQREASYESNDAYSIPIGSRYHPERASIWQQSSAEELTAEWLPGKR